MHVSECITHVVHLLTHYRFLHSSEVPRPLPGVDTRADDHVRLDCVPVDVRDSAVVRAEDMFDAGSTTKEKVPYETARAV